MGHPSLQSAMTRTLHACATFDMQGISWAELAHSPLDFEKVLPGHAVFLSHVKDFSRSQHANVSDPKMVADNYCSLSQSHSVMLTNKFTIIKFTFKNEKKQLQFILCVYNMMIGWSSKYGENYLRKCFSIKEKESCRLQ